MKKYINISISIGFSLMGSSRFLSRFLSLLLLVPLLAGCSAVTKSAQTTSLSVGTTHAETILHSTAEFTAAFEQFLPDASPTLPATPQGTLPNNEIFTVSLSVTCDSLLTNMDKLDKEKHELVPADGVIFPAADVVAYEGESVFNILQREMKQAKIHLEFVNTPIYESAYIEAINNIYEFDAGELSGWVYSVNGSYPNFGCSQYQPQAGDIIEWRYSCDHGSDLDPDLEPTFTGEHSSPLLNYE